MDKTKYRTAAYLRLSKGDVDAGGESNSISSQRLIIDRFLQENPDFELSETYVDDGYTGTNFERPAMKKMLEDIDKGLIDCVVVKDVSRFGRERIETGTYILKTFREKGIRFIAINDNYDSLTADSSERHLVMPIKTMTNDAYSMDISNKVRASQSIKWEKGEFMGPYAPYGYMKDPENRNHLIIDPEAAVTVREIFARRISGMSANAIAKHLEETGVLTPSYYKEKKIEGYRSAATKPGRCRWHAKQIIRILSDEVYIDSMVQGRDYKVSYKVNKIIRRPKEDWVVVPGMHEPIVSESDFRIVQDLMERSSIRTRETPEGYLFSGLIFCADCGRTMLRKLCRQKNTSHVEYLCCGYNLKEGCTSHKILETDLMEAVTESINHMIKKLCEYSRIAANLKNISISRDEAVIQNREINRLREEAAHCEQFRQGLFRDVEDGLLSQEQAERFRAQYSKQIDNLNAAVKERTRIIDDLYSKGLAADEFLEKFKGSMQIEKPDRVLLVSLIDRILIHENGRIEIIYRYSDHLKALDEIMVAEIAKEKE